MNAVHDMKRNVLLRIKPLTRRNAAQGINNGSSPISPFSLRLPLPLLNPPQQCHEVGYGYHKKQECHQASNKSDKVVKNFEATKKYFTEKP